MVLKHPEYAHGISNAELIKEAIEFCDEELDSFEGMEYDSDSEVCCQRSNTFIRELVLRLSAALSHPPAQEGVETAAPVEHVAGNVPCPCTLIEQDEDCPIGYPSMICGICAGKGNTTQEQVTALACEMIKIASDVGEPEDPFAAWESISLIQSQNDQLRKAAEEALQAMKRCEHDGGFDREIGPIGCNLGDKCVCLGIYPIIGRTPSTPPYIEHKQGGEVEPDGWRWIIPAMKKRLKSLSTSEAAKQIGCSKATVSRVSRGSEPRIDHYFQIKRWLSPSSTPDRSEL